MKLNKLAFLMLLLIGMVVAGACAPAAPAPTPTVAPAAPVPTPTVAPTPVAKPPPAPTPTPAALQTVKVGDLGYMANSAIYIPIEKGYFREQGIEVKLERFRSGVDMIAPLSTGDLHVGDGIGVNPGLFNALARGIDLRAIATDARPKAPNDANWWMVRPDLKEQIKTFADFKGRTVNMLAPGAPSYYGLAQALAKYGLTVKDINPVHLTPPDTGPAFQNKAIEISLVVEPNAVLFAEQGLAVKWKQMTQDAPPFDVAVTVYSGPWAKANPELARKFSIAYLKGFREFVAAVRGGPKRPEVVTIAIKYTALKDPAMYEKIAWTDLPDDGYIDKENIRQQQEWFVKNGDVAQAADIGKLVDTSFLEDAKKVLGEFKG